MALAHYAIRSAEGTLPERSRDHIEVYRCLVVNSTQTKNDTLMESKKVFFFFFKI